MPTLISIYNNIYEVSGYISKHPGEGIHLEGLSLARNIGYTIARMSCFVKDYNLLKEIQLDYDVRNEVIDFFQTKDRQFISLTSRGESFIPDFVLTDDIKKSFILSIYILMNYKHKYLKYKSKYNSLKKLVGGSEVYEKPLNYPNDFNLFKKRLLHDYPELNNDNNLYGF